MESPRIRIAVLTGFNQPLGLTQSCSIDENDVLLFWCWVEEVAEHGSGFYHCVLGIDSECRASCTCTVNRLTRHVCSERLPRAEG